MPWCETCQRHYNGSSVAPDGTCMRCGSFIGGDPVGDHEKGPPWHFWVLVVALVVYLGWRLIQFVAWLLS